MQIYRYDFYERANVQLKNERKEDKYRSRAEECRRRAEKAVSEDERDAWLALADSWLQLLRGAGTGADDRTIDASHRYFFRVFGFVLYRLIVEIVDRPSVSSALIVLIPSHFQATNINP